LEDAIAGDGPSRGLPTISGLKLLELVEEEELQAAALARTLEDLASFAEYVIPPMDQLDSLAKSAAWAPD
jgi:hypothetical protein